jgi:flagellar hook protein FlgE
MMRSMFAGVSGLRTHQVKMDVIGNNIANVNTYGFKASRATFQDLLSQTFQGASAPQSGRGGINPQQVGLGVQLASIDTLFSPGNLQGTGLNTDLAIQNDGFFAVGDGQKMYYTRAGNFDFDGQGNLISRSNGMKVYGWMANSSGEIDNRRTVETIVVPKGQVINAVATGQVQAGKNLDAALLVGESITSSIEVFDSLGINHTLKVTFTKDAENQWSWLADGDTLTGTGSGSLEFNSDGSLNLGSAGNASFTLATGANPLSINLDFGSLTQLAEADSSAELINQNGFPMGSLESGRVSFDTNGVITGYYSNGLRKTLGQVALAIFNNPGGLMKVGQTLFEESNNSGVAQLGPANSGGRGSFAPANLEMSNVELAQEFTEMITAQRGFQANSRVITTSDEMLQELVNLKR